MTLCLNMVWDKNHFFAETLKSVKLFVTWPGCPDFDRGPPGEVKDRGAGWQPGGGWGGGSGEAPTSARCRTLPLLRRFRTLSERVKRGKITPFYDPLTSLFSRGVG